MACLWMKSSGLLVLDREIVLESCMPHLSHPLFLPVFSCCDAEYENRLAVAEARLVTAKLLWKFDVELDGPQDGWVDGARFYVSLPSSSDASHKILRCLSGADRCYVLDSVGAAASDGQAEGYKMMSV